MGAEVTDTAHRGVSLIGKVPNHGDFVRCGKISASAQSVFRWLGDGVSHAATQALAERYAPIAFCVQVASGSVAGVWIQSRDNVGRTFPLAAMLDQPELRFGGRRERLPVALRSWAMRAVERLQPLAQTGCDFNQMEEVIGDLGAGDEASISAEEETRFVQEPIAALHSRLFGSPADAAAFYAYRTLHRACRRPESAIRVVSEASPATLVVDCPISDSTDTLLWLPLMQRLLPSAGAPPSLFWSLEASGSLLISFGYPPAELYAYAFGAHRRSPKFWPLRIDNAALCERTKAEFPESLVEAASTATVGEFTDHLLAVLNGFE